MLGKEWKGGREMSTGVCAYNFTVWTLPVTLLGKEWKGRRETSTGVCAYNFTAWILPVSQKALVWVLGKEWEGDKHWCVCLQFHCVDLACDTAGNGRVEGRWAWVCVLKIALCGSCLWHCTITFLYSLWRKSTFYLKGDPRWRVKLASKCRKCANISSYRLLYGNSLNSYATEVLFLHQT